MRDSLPIPKSRHAFRHSAPCGATRRRPARNCASRCANSCRRVRSISAGSCSCKRGFSEMSLRRKSARPAALKSLAFHSTCKELASSDALSACNISCAFLSSSESRPSTTSDGPLEKVSSSCLGKCICFGFRARCGGHPTNNLGDDFPRTIDFCFGRLLA